MGKMQRDKGNRGEREIRNLLAERLGQELVPGRELGQARDSGCDVKVAGAYAIEVKRGERPRFGEWLAQARERVEPGWQPVLAHRRNGEGWMFYLPLDLEDFCELVRENLVDAQTMEILLGKGLSATKFSAQALAGGKGGLLSEMLEAQAKAEDEE